MPTPPSTPHPTERLILRRMTPVDLDFTADPRNGPSKHVAMRAGLRLEKATLWKGRRVEVFVSRAR